MLIRGRANSRNHRICCRTTRQEYWALREMARERGISLSTLLYWMVDHVYAEVLENDTSTVLETISSHLGEEDMARFKRSVESSLARACKDDVPWE